MTTLTLNQKSALLQAYDFLLSLTETADRVDILAEETRPAADRTAQTTRLSDDTITTGTGQTGGNNGK